VASEIDLLLAALAKAPEGLTKRELLARLRERIPYLGPNDVERVLNAASKVVRMERGRVYTVTLKGASTGSWL